MGLRTEGERGVWGRGSFQGNVWVYVQRQREFGVRVWRALGFRVSEGLRLCKLGGEGLGGHSGRLRVLNRAVVLGFEQ